MKVKIKHKISRSAIIKIMILSSILIAIDQITKLMAVNFLVEEFNSVDVLPFFSFTLVFNSGVSFSFLNGIHWLIIFIISVTALVIAVVLLFSNFHKITNFEILILSLIIGGSLGNIIDRLRHNFVVDFLHLHYLGWNFPVFNGADCFITLCAALLIYKMFFNKHK